ncbi:MAG: TIGR03663 family protein [Chloroflexi bacterium]|nr:TIGR03663 family protein [Chloroflexota bacterium]
MSETSSHKEAELTVEGNAPSLGDYSQEATATLDNAAVGLVERTAEAQPQEVFVAPGGREVGWARWEVAAYVILLLVALAMRLWDLGAMALHHDESLHALYAWYLYDGRGYRHDPMMHGPFQFYGYASIFWLLWDSDATVRLLPALFGTALVGVPLLLRHRLGRAGALATSVMLAFSPTMLYYSRFVRNDIYMAVWVLAMVGLLWRYLDTRKRRYLVWLSVVLAFAFATKETSYIAVAVLGSYLLMAAIEDVIPWLLGRKRLREFSPAGELLVVIATLTLPLGAGAIALFQKRLGLTLANPDWTAAPVGIPLGTGLYVAFFTLVGLLIAAVVVGLRWRPRFWLVCFGGFATVWVLYYTSFFTNTWAGLGSGLWRALGYWVAQQDVARGGQPWYYYLVTGLNYEFLPILVGAVAIGYYLVKGDRFSHFLVYWSIANFLMYTYASEKMPWLLVNVTLPFIVLAGKFLGELLERRPWLRDTRSEENGMVNIGKLRRVHWPAAAFSLMAVLFVAVAGRWLTIVLSKEAGLSQFLVWLLAVMAVALASMGAYLLRHVAKDRRRALVGLSLAVVMLAMTIPAAFRVAYANSDVPVEMLVYTQTAPDIPQIMAEIRRLGEETGKGRDLKITVDSSDGFSWPWAWYLRHYKFVGYPCLSNEANCRPLDRPPDADVVLLAARSQATSGQYLSSYGAPVSYKHRWWFPESYRGLNLRTVTKGVRQKESWCRVVRYFTARKFGQGIGSVDAYAYFPKEFKLQPVGRNLAYKDTGC